MKNEKNRINDEITADFFYYDNKRHNVTHLIVVIPWYSNYSEYLYQGKRKLNIYY